MYKNFRDARDRLANRMTGRGDLGSHGPGMFRVLAALLVIVGAVATFIFAGGSPHEQLAGPPDRGQATTLPAPITSPAPQK